MTKERKNSFCSGCRFLFITHDKLKPWGCSNFGFKSRNLPSHVVFATTGMKCAYFIKKDMFIKSQKKYNGRGRIA